MKLLDGINSPADLRKLGPESLPKLADEIREEILSAVSKTGGHLASSLGVVELTIAIHYIFDTPKDRVVWDVGHQGYAHKILTGRRQALHSMRKLGGISGFLKRDESEHDSFGAGHSSTSISAGLGIAEALKLKGSKDRVIAVIGDGSMTAGIAFEALNQAGHLKRDLVVILNDNEMSISSNVGAMSQFLSRKLTTGFLIKSRKEIKSFIKSIPGVGGDMMQWIKRAEESLKTFITPGILFEGLGFRYVGPVPGHSIENLLHVLQNVKNWDGPILVHVQTQKGKGYPPAELDPSSFHGVGPFEIATGKPTSKTDGGPSYTDVFGKALVELARKDDKIVAITAAMGEGTGLSEFAVEFPGRFYDVGIAEQHGVTFAAGLATAGFKPVCAIYSTFLQRAYDQIVHDVCLQNLPVIFVIDRAGLVGADGATHHGIFDLSYMRHIPNMVVMTPKDEAELRHMLKTACGLGKPVAIRYPRGAGFGGRLDGEMRVLEAGKAEVLKVGGDVAIIAAGSCVYPALEAASMLGKAGISACVVNARFVKPVDAELFARLARETGCVVTVEENVLAGGFGSAVLEALASRGVSGADVRCLGVDDVFVEHGSQAELRKLQGIDAEGIQKAVLELAAKKKD